MRNLANRATRQRTKDRKTEIPWIQRWPFIKTSQRRGLFRECTRTRANIRAIDTRCVTDLGIKRRLFRSVSRLQLARRRKEKEEEKEEKEERHTDRRWTWKRRERDALLLSDDSARMEFERGPARVSSLLLLLLRLYAPTSRARIRVRLNRVYWRITGGKVGEGISNGTRTTFQPRPFFSPGIFPARRQAPLNLRLFRSSADRDEIFAAATVDGRNARTAKVRLADIFRSQLCKD